MKSRSSFVNGEGTTLKEKRRSRTEEADSRGRSRSPRARKARRWPEEQGSRAEEREGQVGIGDIRVAKGKGERNDEVRGFAYGEDGRRGGLCGLESGGREGEAAGMT